MLLLISLVLHLHCKSILLIFEAVELFAVVKNSRDSLERAALNVAAVNEYKLYSDFREDTVTDSALGSFVTKEEVIKVLCSEFNMQNNADGIYKMKRDSTDYYKLEDIEVNAVIDDNDHVDRYRIEASVVLSVPVNFMGFGDMEFNMYMHLS